MDWDISVHIGRLRCCIGLQISALHRDGACFVENEWSCCANLTHSFDTFWIFLLCMEAVLLIMNGNACLPRRGSRFWRQNFQVAAQTTSYEASSSSGYKHILPMLPHRVSHRHHPHHFNLHLIFIKEPHHNSLCGVHFTLSTQISLTLNDVTIMLKLRQIGKGWQEVQSNRMASLEEALAQNNHPVTQ